MSFVVSIPILVFLQSADGLCKPEKPTIVSIYPIYNNGSRAPETIFDVDKPGTIEIQIFLKDSLMLTLKMIRNKVYRGEGYKESIIKREGVSGAKVKLKENCRFYGQLKDSSTSEAALTFCNGISGYVYSTEAEYRFKPIGKKMDEAYLKTTPLSPNSKVEREKRDYKYSYDRIVSVLEIYIINDIYQFEGFDRNPDDVFNWALEVVSLVARVLQRYDLHIVLTGMEIWDVSLFKYKSVKTFTEWLHYKRDHLLKRLPKHDTVFMFTSKDKRFSSSMDRLSVKFAMCDMHETGGIILKTDTLEESAVTMLYLIGRLLGLRKESEFTTACRCPATYCIMHGNSSHNRALTFSDCSAKELRSSLNKRNYPCLVTPAKLELAAVCGNGFLEGDEECDCGNLISPLCEVRCCDIDNCRLRDDEFQTECASGKCCDLRQCRLKHERTVCRRQFGMCDVAEYCDGLSPQCPPDEGVEDGTKCEGGNYCFSGRCGGRAKACQKLWGPGATDAYFGCYGNNAIHHRFGHCYADYSKSDPYLTCQNFNIFCGILMCLAPDIDITKITIRPSRIYKIGFHLNACFALEYRYWKYDYNPGYVPDGSLCDSDKVCFRRRCIGESIIPSISKYYFSLDIGTTHKMNTWFMAAFAVAALEMLE